jgi:protease I
MKMIKLNGKKIAVLVANGFEQSELEEPVEAIKKAGGEVEIVSPEKDKVKAWKDGDWSKEIKVDRALNDANPDDYDGLVLPGGVINPDHLRMNEKAIAFIKGFFSPQRQKPVAAICHGPWSLINAGLVKGRRMTSYASVRKDLENAGAEWVDEPVVVDKGLVTSRQPDDLPAFNKKMVEEFAEGTHNRNRAQH